MHKQMSAKGQLPTLFATAFMSYFDNSMRILESHWIEVRLL